MNTEEKKELFNISIQDFMKKFKEQNYTNPKEALNDSMHYIARLNKDPKNRRCDINELLFVAKNEILKMIARKQLHDEEHGIKHNKDKDDLMLKSFIANPVKATAYYLSKKQDTFDKIKKTKNDPLYVTILRQNASFWANILNKPQASSNYRKFLEKKSKSIDLVAQLEAQLPYSYDPLGSEIKKQKANIIENILGRTSKEYKTFIRFFNHHYKNPNSPLYGNDDYLKELALKYLRHKFPNLKEDELPTEQQINKLSGKGKARSRFCLNIINHINEKQLLAERIRLIDQEIKNSNEKFLWISGDNQEKSLLEQQLENEEKNNDIKIDNDHISDENKNDVIIDDEENFDQFDLHDEQYA